MCYHAPHPGLSVTHTYLSLVLKQKDVTHPRVLTHFMELFLATHLLYLLTVHNGHQVSTECSILFLFRCFHHLLHSSLIIFFHKISVKGSLLILNISVLVILILFSCQYLLICLHQDTVYQENAPRNSTDVDFLYQETLLNFLTN